MYYSDGRIYNGMWKEDKCHGEGMLTESGKDSKKGIWEYG